MARQDTEVVGLRTKRAFGRVTGGCDEHGPWHSVRVPLKRTWYLCCIGLGRRFLKDFWLLVLTMEKLVHECASLPCFRPIGW